MYSKKIVTTMDVEMIISDLEYELNTDGPVFENYFEEIDFLRKELGDQIVYPILFELMELSRNMKKEYATRVFSINRNRKNELLIGCMLRVINKDGMGNPIVKATINFNDENKIEGRN